ncbi:MAG: hypothetical protein KC519_23620, partial [Anaerolineae bacterium]|nr:hypothetical protein [Anaerolineae bacterium]
YLDRGGAVSWGIIPNNDQITSVTPMQLAERLRAGIDHISQKAALRDIRITPDDFAARSLITPSCGLGSASVELAERVLETLARTGEFLQAG